MQYILKTKTRRLSSKRSLPNKHEFFEIEKIHENEGK